MKAIVQRVINASVTVDGKVVSSIGKGLCVLVGIGRKDAPKDAEWLARKILNLRIFDGDNGRRWDKSVLDKQYEVLCVSQFTLFVEMKGNKPDFHNSMGPDLSQLFYGNFLEIMKQNYSEEKIKDGVFGAMMLVHIENDGPVTIPLESPEGLPEPKVRKQPPNSKKTSQTTDNTDNSLEQNSEQSSQESSQSATQSS